MSDIRQIERDAKQVLENLQRAADELTHPELRHQAAAAADDQDRALVRVTAIRIALDAIEKANQ